MPNENEKYLSKWSGENIDRAYEVIKDLNIGDMNKLTYVDSNGNLKATSFTKEKIGLLDTVSWSAKPSNNFVIKNENGNIALSNYNYYSFVGYWDSGATTGPEQCLSSFYTETSGSITKYYVQNTGITTLQLRTAFSDIEDLKAAIGSGGETDLATRVATLENTTSLLTTDVFDIKNQIGTSSQEGSILYRLAQIDNTLTTKANVSDVNTALEFKEDKSNKVTSLSAGSTNTQYPSAKIVYDSLVLKANASDVALKEDKSNKVISLSASSTDTEYPSAKCVYDAIASSSSPIVAGTGIEITGITTKTIALDTNPDIFEITANRGMTLMVENSNPVYKDSKLLMTNAGVTYLEGTMLYVESSSSINFISNYTPCYVNRTTLESKTLATTDQIINVAGVNDGTNWTSITIGNTTKAIPSGGGGGTTVSGTNDGTNWTTITISGSTYNIPNNGSVTISQVQVNDPAKVPSSALMYSVNSRVVELETQLAAALQEINSLKQRVSAIEEDYVVAIDDHTEVEVSGNNIKFISDVTTSGNEISFTQSSTHLDGNDILL